MILKSWVYVGPNDEGQDPKVKDEDHSKFCYTPPYFANRKRQTDSTGFFAIDSLDAGDYLIEIYSNLDSAVFYPYVRAPFDTGEIQLGSIALEAQLHFQGMSTGLISRMK